jgi:hypothetical protein
MHDLIHVAEKNSNGDLLVRDALVAAFFCQRPYPELAIPFGQLFAQWERHTLDDAKRWAIVGPDAEEYKPVTPRLLVRARAELDPTRARTRDMSCFEMGGPEKINPEHQFSFIGVGELQEQETNFVEVRSPSAEADVAHVEAYVEFVRSIAELLPYDSGYASLGLVAGVDSQDFAPRVRRWAFRHPGFDIPCNHASNSSLGKKLRGAYWLTFVGQDALSALGGEGPLRKALPREILVQPVGAGVMLRASQLPEVGDVNCADNLPVLRSVAKVLESVSLFGDRFLNNAFVDEDQRARWERRHLD